LTGTKIREVMPVKTVRRYIDWRMFLTAWKLPVRYLNYMQAETPEEKRQWLDTVPEEEREKAGETVRLLNDAQTVLDEWSEKDPGFIRAITAFYPIEVRNESLAVKKDNREIIIPLLRQQEKRDDNVYKSLADFFRPEGDYAGFFVTTAGQNEKVCDCVSHSHDDYEEILRQLLKDRLAEAAAEYLHEQVRKIDWGYASGESLTPGELVKAQYSGIRPASGYPSLPDLSLNFILDELLDMKKIGVHLTPNGAMNPNASVAGLYLSHPESDYFMVGKIDDDQLADYAAQKGASVEETKKWLGI
jgi:5-methyltetrahydrofolate--homocysteine methyltransferase